MRYLALLPFLLLPTGDGRSDDARRAFEEGRFAEACDAFAAQEEAEGAQASPFLAYNRALAAWRAGRWREAELAAERAATRDPAAFGPRRDFLLGNLAFERAQAAGAQAEQLEAEPFAYDAAIVEMRSAASHWQRAAVAREGWPEARRNAERARLEIARLEARKTSAHQRAAKKAGVPEARIHLVPEGAEAGAAEGAEGTESAEGETRGEGKVPSAPAGSAEARRWSPRELERVLNLLDAKEDEKAAARRRSRERRSAGVEKDW